MGLPEAERLLNLEVWMPFPGEANPTSSKVAVSGEGVGEQISDDDANDVGSPAGHPPNRGRLIEVHGIIMDLWMPVDPIIFFTGDSGGARQILLSLKKVQLFDLHLRHTRTDEYRQLELNRFMTVLKTSLLGLYYPVR